jgi:hypothetical protein
MFEPDALLRFHALYFAVVAVSLVIAKIARSLFEAPPLVSYYNPLPPLPLWVWPLSYVLCWLVAAVLYQIV